MTLAPLTSLGLVHRNQSTRCDLPTSLSNQAQSKDPMPFRTPISPTSHSPDAPKPRPRGFNVSRYFVIVTLTFPDRHLAINGSCGDGAPPRLGSSPNHIGSGIGRERLPAVPRPPTNVPEEIVHD